MCVYNYISICQTLESLYFVHRKFLPNTHNNNNPQLKLLIIVQQETMVRGEEDSRCSVSTIYSILYPTVYFKATK